MRALIRDRVELRNSANLTAGSVAKMLRAAGEACAVPNGSRRVRPWAAVEQPSAKAQLTGRGGVWALGGAARAAVERAGEGADA